MSGTPYVDFYRSLGISPVAQDVADLERHFRRRDSLYRFLGLPPLLVKDRSVIEFGPGSGHNALFTAALRPARYLLADGNPVGVAETRANLARYKLDGPGVEVVESLFEDFDSEERFDIVLAEGFLPHTRDPAALLRRLARFVRPGGLLVITTVSPASVLPETTRRLMRSRIIDADAPADAQLAALRPLLGPHLATLKGMSRSVDDWLLDNVVQPMGHAALLTIPEAVATLADDFDAYGASPAFFTDFRWYKTICEVERGFNANIVDNYRRRTATLIDHRFEPPPHSAEEGLELEAACRVLWDVMKESEAAGGRLSRSPQVADLLNVLAEKLRSVSSETAAALDEAAAVFAGRADAAAMTRFPAFWGRGQQYLSFIRRGDPISTD